MQYAFSKKDLLQWWLPCAAAIAFFTAGIILEENLLLVFPFAVLAIIFFTSDIKALFYFLVFCIPLSTEFAVTATLSTDLPDEPLMLMVAVSVFVLLITRQQAMPVEIRKSPLFLLLLIYFLWMAVTIFFSYDVLLSVKYMLAKTWYVLAFVFGILLFVKTKKDYENLSKAFVFSMLIPVTSSLVRHATKGFTFESINETLDPFFRNHVNYSAILACLLPVIVTWYCLTQKNQRKKIGILLAFFTAALFFAYSRGAWLCMLTGALTWIAVKKRFLFSLILVSILVSLISLYWLIQNDNFMKFAPDFNKTIQHFDLSEHMEATYQLKDMSTMERFYRWIAGMRMINEEKLTGFGPNNFNLHYKDYTVAAFKTWVSNNEEKSSVHNYFLLVTIEQGIPGLIIFSLLLLLMFRTALQGYHFFSDRVYKLLSILCAVILSMVVTLNLLSDLIETDKVGSIYFIIMAVLMQLQVKMQLQKAGQLLE
jgi:O-antigen ligase